MKVTIRSVLGLSRAVGASQVLLDLHPGSTAEQALSELAQQRGGALSRLLWDESGKLIPYNRILVNGRDIGFLSGPATELQDGDEITLIPPAGGG